MYAAQMSSLYSAYILSFSFPAIISIITILLSSTMLCIIPLKKNTSRENTQRAPENSRPEGFSVSISASFYHMKKQIKTHHISYIEKLGVSIFILGFIVMISTVFMGNDNIDVWKTYIISGDILALS